MDFRRLKLRCWQNPVPAGGSRGQFMFLTLTASLAYDSSAHGPSTFKPSIIASSTLSLSLSLSLNIVSVIILPALFLTWFPPSSKDS